MKKILLIGLCIALCWPVGWGLLYAYAYLFFESADPVADITGCYTGHVNGIEDKFCIHSTGRYEQFSPLKHENERRYNEGLWRSFTYRRQNADFVNGVLVGYLHIDENGELVKVSSINIRPYESTFGQIVAVVHNRETGKSARYEQW